MFLHSMSLRLLEDSGTITRESKTVGGLRRMLGGGGDGNGIEQSRRIVTDAGVLHCEARVGARVELSVDLEPASGARRTRLMHVSQKKGPDLMAGIEAGLRRTVESARA